MLPKLEDSAQCHLCHDLQYLHPKMKLKVSPCHHIRVCKRCMDKAPSNQTGIYCEECSRTRDSHHAYMEFSSFAPQVYEDFALEKGERARRNVEKELFLQKDNFNHISQYNDFLEAREDIVEKLSESYARPGDSFKYKEACAAIIDKMSSREDGVIDQGAKQAVLKAISTNIEEQQRAMEEAAREAEHGPAEDAPAAPEEHKQEVVPEAPLVLDARPDVEPIAIGNIMALRMQRLTAPRLVEAETREAPTEPAIEVKRTTEAKRLVEEKVEDVLMDMM